MNTLPASLPEETKELYSKSLSQPLKTRSDLSDMVQSQLSSLKAKDQDGVADLTLAEEIAAGLLKLIAESSDADLAHVQAACSYFTSDEDVLSDLDSIAGLDDDAQVYNAVCAHLNRSDLEVV